MVEDSLIVVTKTEDAMVASKANDVFLDVDNVLEACVIVPMATVLTLCSVECENSNPQFRNNATFVNMRGGSTNGHE